MSPHVRLALIGGGDHGLRALAAAVAQLPGWSIEAVADPDAGARSRATSTLPQARVHASHQELLRQERAVDLIVIATPPAVTAGVAAEAMATTSAIVIEKPGAMSASALDVLATERTRPTSCAYSYRFHPTIIAFHAALPRVGPLERLELCFTAPMETAGTWRASRASGGGALRDLGTHLLDLAGRLLKTPLTFETGSIRSHRTGDDDVTLEFSAAAVRVRVRCAYHGAPVFSLRAVGRHGALSADLWSMTTPARGLVETVSSRVRTKLSATRRPAAALLTSRMEMLRAAVAPSVANPPASIADAAAVLRLVEHAEAGSTS